MDVYCANLVEYVGLFRDVVRAFVWRLELVATLARMFSALKPCEDKNIGVIDLIWLTVDIDPEHTGIRHEASRSRIELEVATERLTKVTDQWQRISARPTQFGGPASSALSPGTIDQLAFDWN